MFGLKRILWTYQFSGVESGFSGSQEFGGPCKRSVSHDSFGQHDSCFLYQLSRRNSLAFSVLSGDRALGVVSSEGHSSPSLSHSGGGQSGSRLLVEGEVSPIRMDFESLNISKDLSGSQSSTGDRPFRIHPQLSSSEVLCPFQGSSGLEGGRTFFPVVRPSSVCLPTILYSSQSPGEDCSRRSRRGSGSSLLASEAVVPKVTVSSGGLSQNTSSSEGSSVSTYVAAASSQAGESSSLTLAAFREKGKQAGLSIRAAEALRESTRVTYDSKLECFFKWCEGIPCDPSSTSLGRIADFLIYLFDKGLAVSTIRSYRSAIASCHKGFQDGSSVSVSPVLSRLCRSFLLKRPPVKTLLPAWSLPVVLRALARAPFEPIHKASLHILSIKAAFLVAIASGHRVSTLHALSIEPGHVRWELKGVRLVPRADFIAKNQSPASQPVEIFLPSISSFSSVEEDKVWCPVRALKWYLDRTRSKRTSSSLFVSSIEPFQAVSKASISRWLVKYIRMAGPEALITDRVRAHDTRSVSSSWALFNGASLKDIQQAAYWSSPNSFISCCLKDVLVGEASFASAVFKTPSSGPRESGSASPVPAVSK